MLWREETRVCFVHSVLIMRVLACFTLAWSWLTLAAARCPTDVLVMYKTILQTEWSEEKFPKQYPEWRPPAQWSVVVGRSHNSSGILWSLGKTASDSVKMFIETGKADLLIRESAEQKRGILSEFFAPPLSQGVGNTQATFFVDSTHSKVSMICRITPSPDWFIGVDSFDLCKGSKWVDYITLDLEPTDGGTDNGYTFTSPKWATVPRSSISPIKASHPSHPASSFFYPKLEKLPRIAHVTFLKMKEFYLSKEIKISLRGESLVLAKNTTNITQENIISSMGELRRLSSKKDRKLRREKKKNLARKEINAFTSKAETTITNQDQESHKKHHRTRSCRVSEWSDWGSCSNTCGFGEEFRKRKIIHFGSKNSRPCPPLEESRWCRSSETCGNKTSGLFRWH
ncbi:spondin-2 [Parasteatoda tepidariorum]|uniref:spondin-2 n=1 Tax=Parasteatoda tepidariorum TaxID=114398 RepID=UPI001C723890|nr:spondin-2-like [Parasteatoda tepidariorum]